MYKLSALIFLAALILSCSSENSVPDKSGKEILLEYNEVASSIKTASFTLKYSFDDPKDQSEPYNSEIDVYMRRNPNSQNKNLPFEIRLDYKDGLTSIVKNDVSYIIDNANKNASIGYFDSLGYAYGIDGNFVQSVITEIMMPSDFSEMISNLQDSIQVLPYEEYNGTDCYVIYTEHHYEQYDVTMIQKTWIARDDKLPRKTIQMQASGKDTAKMITEYTIKDIDFDFDENKLDTEFIADYEQTVFKAPEKQAMLSTGDKAPDFELTNHEGKTVSLSDYKGKVVLIDFWGTWCVWCVRSFPKLEKAYTELKNKNVEFLGVSCQEPEDADPVAFAREKGISYPILLNGDPVAAKYHVNGFPTLFLIDKEGKIILSKSGFDENLDQMIINEVDPFL